MNVSKKKIGIYTMGAVLLVAGIFVASRSSSASSDAEAAGETAVGAIAVETQQVTAAQGTATLTYNATLEPCEKGIVSSNMSGKVVAVLVEDGQAVSAGDVLVKLDDQDIQANIKSAQQQLAVTQSQLKSAQSQVESTKSQLSSAENQLLSSQASLEKLQLNVESAQRSYDQAEALYAQGAGAKTDVDSADSALKLANADLKSGEVGIQTAQVAVQTAQIAVQTAQVAVETAQANVDAAKVTVSNYTDSLNDAVICAPIAGVVDEKSVNLGQYVSAGTVLAKVKNVTSLNAVIQVEQDNVSQLQEGMSAQLTISGVEGTYTGTLSSIGVSADEDTRTFTCKVAVGNENQSLHAGDFVTVTLYGEQTSNVLTVPLKALSGSEGDYSVFVLDNATAKKTSVTVGEITQDNAVITAGLTEGQSVIITNLNVLQDGDAVSVSTSEEGD